MISIPRHSIHGQLNEIFSVCSHWPIRLASCCCSVVNASYGKEISTSVIPCFHKREQTDSPQAWRRQRNRIKEKFVLDGVRIVDCPGQIADFLFDRVRLLGTIVQLMWNCETPDFLSRAELL